MNDPYAQHDKDDLILRDELALDRTRLANERTLLAYLRSAIALVIAGLTMIHFGSQGWFRIMGLACIPGGVLAGVIGWLRYRRMDRAIRGVRGLPDSIRRE